MATNKEKQLARAKKYREANREKIRAAQRAYYEANKEKERERSVVKDRKYKAEGKRAAVVQAYKKRHPERNRARVAVYYAIKSGKLQRQPCAVCGHTPAQAHHHNGYEVQHALDVIWLCVPHHRAAENN